MATAKPKYETAWTQIGLPATKRAYGVHINYAIVNDRVEDKPVKKAKILYGSNNLAVVRDVENAADTVVFAGHLARVKVVAAAPNGNWIASGDETGLVHVWAYPQLSIVNSVRVGSSINDVRWTADSEMLVAAGNGNSEYAKAFRFKATNPLGKIDRITKEVLSVDWSPARPHRVAVADEDMEVLFYHGVPFKYESRSQHHKGFPNVVRFSPDGKYFVTVGSDSKIFAYDGKTGELIKEVVDPNGKGHTGSIFGLAWDATGAEFATASADRTIKIWNIETSTVVHTWTSEQNTGEVDDQQAGLAWAPSPNPVSLALNGTFNVWDRASEKPNVIYGHRGAIAASVFARETKTLYTADLDGRIVATNVDTGVMTWFQGQGHGGKAITALAVSPDGGALFSAGLDGTLQQHVAATQRFGTIVATFPSDPRAIAVNQNGVAVLSLANGNLISVVNGQAREDVVAVDAQKLRFNPAGDKLYAVSPKAKSFVVLNVDANGALQQAAAPASQYQSLPQDIAILPDGHVILNEGNELVPWNTELSDLVGYGWAFHTSAIVSLALSPSSKLLASVGDDKALVIWKDLVKFKPKNLLIRDIHPTGYSFVDWIDETTLLTISTDGVIKRVRITVPLQ